MPSPDTLFLSLSYTHHTRLQEKEVRMLLPVDGLKLQVVDDTGLMKRKNTISLFYPDNRNVYKDHKTLDLTASSNEEMEAW